MSTVQCSVLWRHICGDIISCCLLQNENRGHKENTFGVISWIVIQRKINQGAISQSGVIRWTPFPLMIARKESEIS